MLRSCFAPCGYLAPVPANAGSAHSNRPIASEKEITALIARLAHPRYSVREAASRSLEETGFAAITPLRRAAKTSDDPEVRWRATQIVAAYDQRLRALQKAIGDEDIAEIERCVRAGVDVNSRNVDGTTPLHAACRNDASDLVRFLLKEGASAHAKTNNGFTPLHFVYCKKHSNHTYNATKMAVIVKIMVEHDVDVNARTDDGYTALHYSTARSKGERTGELTQILLNAGANPRVRTKKGMTPLHFAAWNGIADSARLLMDAGAEISFLDARDKTPLDDALHRGHATLAKTLQLRKGKSSNQLKQ